MKVSLKGKKFVKGIEIDGGALMRAGILTYMWVQMGFPTGAVGVRSRMIA